MSVANFFGSSLIKVAAAITARKLAELIRKHQPSLTNNSNRPAIDGPTSLPLFIRNEFNAMALGRSSLDATIWLISDWRAGVSKAMMTP